MTKFQFFAVCTSLVCWCVFIACFLIALAMWNCPVILDYIAAGGVIGGVLFFSLAVIFNKEGKK